MVAYSFKPRFAEPILAGTKQQTIRAVGRRRHAKPGDELQLYMGMRTSACRLIARRRCIDVRHIVLILDDEDPTGDCDAVAIEGHGRVRDMSGFARADGFQHWLDLKEFWRVEHPGVSDFDGLLIRWSNQ